MPDVRALLIKRTSNIEHFDIVFKVLILFDFISILPNIFDSLISILLISGPCVMFYVLFSIIVVLEMK